MSWRRLHRSALATVIWNASRADEGTISAIGAEHVADAVMAFYDLYDGEPRTPADMVRQFHEVFGAPIAPEGYQGLGDEELRRLRAELIREEFVDELLPALGLMLVYDPDDGLVIINTGAELDRVEVADALGDLVYVIFGAALAFGIPLDAVVREIHRSNMTKLGADGKPIYREGDQKVMKGPNYERPQIARVLGMEES